MHLQWICMYLFWATALASSPRLGRRVWRLGVVGDLSFTVEAPLGTQKFTFQGDATVKTLRDALHCWDNCWLFAASLEEVVKRGGGEVAGLDLPSLPLANLSTRLVSMLRLAGEAADPILGLRALLRGLLWTPPSTKRPDSDSVAAQSGLLALEKQHRVIVHATRDPGMVLRYGDPFNMLSTSLLPSTQFGRNMNNMNCLVFDASKCQAFAGAESMHDLFTGHSVEGRYTAPDDFLAKFIMQKSSGGTKWKKFVHQDEGYRHVYVRKDKRPVGAQNGDTTWVDDQADMLNLLASGYAEYMEDIKHKYAGKASAHPNEVLATCPLAAFLGIAITPSGRGYQQQWAVQLQIASEKLNRSLFWLSLDSPDYPYISGLRIVDAAMPGNLGELSDVQQLGLEPLGR